MAEEQTTGTPGQEGGDAAQAVAGTPGAEGRDAESKEPDYKTLYLQAKDKVEEANRLREQLASQAQPPPAADVSDEEQDAYWAYVRQQANQGAGWAKADLATLKKLEAREQADAERDMVIREIFEALPEDRKAPIQEYAKNPGLYGSVKAAKAEVERRKLAETVTAKDARIAELEKETARLKANRVDPNTVPTDTREGSVSNGKSVETITRAEWQSRQDSLPADERRRQQNARARREIQVRG